MTHEGCLTIKVQHAISVFVSVLQQLIDLILRDRLSSAADDLSELVPVNVAVGVPVRKLRVRCCNNINNMLEELFFFLL